jgi:hypothetical protein
VSLFAKRWVTVYSGGDIEKYTSILMALERKRIRHRAKLYDIAKFEFHLEDGDGELPFSLEPCFRMEGKAPSSDSYVVEIRRRDSERVKAALK